MAKTPYARTSLTGGGADALDKIDGAVLNDGDIAQVRTSANILYDYSLDADGGGVESSPDRIIPDTNPGTKVWLLQNIYTGAIFASPALTGTPTAPTAADNTSTTQIATTAFAKSEDAVLRRSPGQAVNMTAVASGSSGITVADNDNIDFGTGNFTLVWKGSLPDWTPSATIIVMYKSNAGNTLRYGFAILSTGACRVYANGSIHDGTVNLESVDGTEHEIAIAYTPKATGNGSILIYKDAVLKETISVDTGPNTVSNDGNLLLFGIADIRYAGTCSFAATFNRALTAAEVLDLYRNGINFADKYGSQTELMPNQVDRDFSGASAWADVDLVSGSGAYDETGDLTITAGAAGAGDYCTCPVASVPTSIGYKYRLKLDVANLVGTWTIKSFDGTQTIGTVSATGLQQAFEWVATTTGGLRLVAVSNLASGDFDNFTLTKLGATLALQPEGIQADKWYDSSSNALDASYPATGSSITRDQRYATADHIGESTAAHGVVIDGVTLKDGIVTGTGITATAASLIIKPTTDAVTAVQIADKDGNAILTVDTTNDRVGIVTTVPNAKVDVAWGGYQGIPAISMGADIGNLSTKTNATDKFGMIVTSHYTNAEEPFTVLYGYGQTGTNAIGIGGGMAAHNAATDIVFWTAANTTTVTGTEAMRINNGNFIIGATSGSYNLTLANDSAGKPGVGGLWTVVSDEHIKTDIELADLKRCYEIVRSIPLKRFGWAENTYTEKQVKDRHNLGWIAQDVQKVFPKAVNTVPFTRPTEIPDGEEEYEEQDFVMETVEKESVSIEIRDGKAVQVKKIVTEEVKTLLFDTCDVFDEAGNQVFTKHDGEDIPLTHKVPRMLKKTRPKHRHEVIEDCLDLNSGQLYAAMYGAIQALMAKVEMLEAKLQP